MYNAHNAMKRIAYYMEDVPSGAISVYLSAIKDIIRKIDDERCKNDVSDILNIDDLGTAVIFKELSKEFFDKIFDLFVYQHANNNSLSKSLYITVFVLVEACLKADFVSRNCLESYESFDFNYSDISEELIRIPLNDCNKCRKLTELFVKEMKFRYERYNYNFELTDLEMYNGFISYMNDIVRRNIIEIMIVSREHPDLYIDYIRNYD